MYYLEIALFVVGLVTLVGGYRKNSRNVLLAAAVLLFLAGALGSAVEGFIEGFNQTSSF